MLFFGPAGTGKTTLAKIIANSVESDVMYINASDENSVDAVRDKIKRYASTVGFKRWKIVILDEADYLTPNAQAALRNLMETYSKTTRFILTCNYVEKIIDPIQSRCQTFAITPPNKTDVAKRLVQVLEKNQVEFDIKDVAAIINASYPDIRRAINAAQASVVNGVLQLDKTSAIQANYMTEVLELLKAPSDKKKTFISIRQIIADSKVRDFTPLYTFLYDRLGTYLLVELRTRLIKTSDTILCKTFKIRNSISCLVSICHSKSSIRYDLKTENFYHHIQSMFVFE